jgi:hypothetical protein
MSGPPAKRQRSEEGRRELLSCVQGLTVAEERKLLAEIRKLGLHNINRTTRLSNGMYAQEFAMVYVIGNRRKRQKNMQKSKQKSAQRKRDGIVGRSERKVDSVSSESEQRQEDTSYESSAGSCV